MTVASFVDTNVFAYARDVTQARKQAVAIDWIGRLWHEQSGRTSMQVLSELYVTLTRKIRPSLGPDEAWADVESLLAWEPQPVDRELTMRAREIERRYRIAWWDALIVAAAELQECDTLLSEDLQDGMRFGTVTVRNPFASRASESAGEYRTDLGIARRHRRPGRPRKRAATLPA